MGMQLRQLAFYIFLEWFLGVISVLTNGWNSQKWPEYNYRVC